VPKVQSWRGRIGAIISALEQTEAAVRDRSDMEAASRAPANRHDRGSRGAEWSATAVCGRGVGICPTLNQLLAHPNPPLPEVRFGRRLTLQLVQNSRGDDAEGRRPLRTTQITRLHPSTLPAAYSLTYLFGSSLSQFGTVSKTRRAITVAKGWSSSLSLTTTMTP
jgi:hypothetical protein